MRKFLSTLLLLLLPVTALAAQTLSGLPAASQAGTVLTAGCPAAATGAEIWRCTGTSSSCTATSTNWTELGTITLASGAGSYTDLTGVIGTTYGYANICTEGSTIAPPAPLYFGTPTSPLAAGSLSGTTS